MYKEDLLELLVNLMVIKQTAKEIERVLGEITYLHKYLKGKYNPKGKYYDLLVFDTRDKKEKKEYEEIVDGIERCKEFAAIFEIGLETKSKPTLKVIWLKPKEIKRLKKLAKNLKQIYYLYTNIEFEITD